MSVGFSWRSRIWSYSLLDILVGLAGGEVRGVREGRGNREDIRAVDESGGIVAELTHGLEDELEPVLKFVLVGCNVDNTSASKLVMR